MIHLTFNDTHVQPIRRGDKRLTMRYGFDKDLSVGDTIKFRDSNNILFGKGVCTSYYTMPVINIVETAWKYHYNYSDIEDFKKRFNIFYPDVEFEPDTEIHVIEWSKTFSPIHDYFGGANER